MLGSNRGTVPASTHSTASPIQPSFSLSSGWPASSPARTPRIHTTNSPIHSRSPKRASSFQNRTSSRQCAKQLPPSKSSQLHRAAHPHLQPPPAPLSYLRRTLHPDVPHRHRTLPFCTQLRGGRITYIMRRFKVESFLKAHARFQVTDLLIVPPSMNAIVVSGLAGSKGQKNREECSVRSVQYGILGAATLGAVMQRRLQGLMAPRATLGQLCGMKELTCIATRVKPGTNSEEVDYFGMHRGTQLEGLSAGDTIRV
jgi:hypothetical protein